MSGRKYRSSLIGAFSTNLAFVLLECDAEPAKRVLAMHQEKPVKMGRCSDVECDWDEFVYEYKVSTDRNPCLIESSKLVAIGMKNYFRSVKAILEGA